MDLSDWDPDDVVLADLVGQYSAALGRVPDTSLFYADRIGLRLAELDRHLEACQVFRQIAESAAMAHAPLVAGVALAHLGECHEALSEFDAAHMSFGVAASMFLAASDEDGEPHTRQLAGVALAARARAATASGEIDLSPSELETALALLSEDDSARRTQIADTLAELAASAGDAATHASALARAAMEYYRAGRPGVAVERLLDSADVALRADLFADARGGYRTAIEVGALAGKSQTEAYARMRYGQLCAAEENWAEAEEHLTRSLARHQEFDDPVNIAVTAHALVNVYRSTERTEQSLAMAEEGLAAAARTDVEPLLRTELLSIAALCSVDLKRYDAAVDWYDRLRLVEVDIGDPAKAANTLATIGHIHWTAGKPVEASAALELAAAELLDAGQRDESALASLYSAHGATHRDLAWRYDRYCEALLRCSDSETGLAVQKTVLTTMVEDLMTSGAIAAAEPYIELGQNLAKATSDVASAITFRTQRGEALLATGDYARAREELESAVRLARAEGVRHETATALLILGNAHAAVGRYDQSFLAYKEAREAFDAVGDIDGAATALVNASGVWLKGDLDPHVALDWVNAAFESYRDFASPEFLPRAALCYAARGSIYAALEDYEVAIEDTLHALKLFDQLQDLGRAAAAATNLAEFSWRNGQHDHAETALARARHMFARSDRTAMVADCDVRRALWAGEAIPLRDLLPAYLYLRSVALQFGDSRTRIAWRYRLRMPRFRAFAAAAAHGDARLVAELVETAVNEYAFGGSTPQATDYAADFSMATANAAPFESGLTATLEVSGAAGLLVGARLPVAPPPPLVMASGAIAMQDYFDVAAERYAGVLTTGEPVSTI